MSHSRWLRVAPRGTRPVRQAQVLGYDFDGDGFEDLAFKQAVVRGAADLKQAHVQRLTAAPLGTCVLPVQAESNDGICTNLHAPHPLGDVDGDGADDLVVRLEGKGPVLFRGGARGSDPWQPARQLCLAESPCWTATDWRAIGDVDADGFADAASADGLVAHGGPAGWRRPPRPAIAARSYVGFAGGGDLDGDGFSDVVGLSRDGKLHVYRGSATGLEAARLVDVGLDAMQRDSVVARRIQLGDLDGDGFVDIIGAMDAPNESVTLWMVSGHSLADASPRVTKRVWPHKREHSWEMPWFAWTYDAHVGGASARLLVADRGEEHQELVEVTFAGGELLIGSSPRRYGWLQERKPFPCGDLDGDAQDEVCVEGAPAIDGQRTVEVVLGTPSERPPFRGLLYGFAERGEHAVFVERTTTTEAERKQLHASGIETYESGSP